MATIDNIQTALAARVTWFDCLVPPQESLRRSASMRPAAHSHVSITIRERLTSRTASVSWSDSQLGSLAEQVWSLGRARMENVCFISGEHIKRGDPVFRPRKTRPPAINERSVIAAHHVLDAPLTE